MMSGRGKNGEWVGQAWSRCMVQYPLGSEGASVDSLSSSLGLSDFM